MKLLIATMNLLSNPINSIFKPILFGCFVFLSVASQSQNVEIYDGYFLKYDISYYKSSDNLLSDEVLFFLGTDDDFDQELFLQRVKEETIPEILSHYGNKVMIFYSFSSTIETINYLNAIDSSFIKNLNFLNRDTLNQKLITNSIINCFEKHKIFDTMSKFNDSTTCENMKWAQSGYVGLQISLVNSQFQILSFNSDISLERLQFPILGDRNFSYDCNNQIDKKIYCLIR